MELANIAGSPVQDRVGLRVRHRLQCSDGWSREERNSVFTALCSVVVFLCVVGWQMEMLSEKYDGVIAVHVNDALHELGVVSR